MRKTPPSILEPSATRVLYDVHRWAINVNIEKRALRNEREKNLSREHQQKKNSYKKNAHYTHTHSLTRSLYLGDSSHILGTIDAHRIASLVARTFAHLTTTVHL